MFNNLIDSKRNERTKSLFEKLSKIAKVSTFIMRKRKLSAEAFLLCLFKSIFNGKASFHEMASRIGRLEKPISKQALWKRIDASAIKFLLNTLASALSERWERVSEKHLALRDHFGRILVEDSTQHRFHMANSETFNAHGNGRSKTAGIKVDLTVDLLTGQVLHEAIHCATAQDRELGKDLVDLVKPRDLVLRDMGYFSLAEFRLIESLGAYWLSRIPSNVHIKTLEGRAIEEVLGEAETNLIDMAVTLGGEAKPARLVAMRATTEVAEKNIREASERARQRGHTLSAVQKERCRWHLIATNVPSDKMDAQAASDLYTCRWSIEIIFRAWKQGMNLAPALNRKSNEHHLQALVLAAMIYQALALRVVELLRAKFERKKGEVSFEKTFSNFAEVIIESSTLNEITHYDPTWTDIRMDPRNDRQPLVSTWFSPLS